MILEHAVVLAALLFGLGAVGACVRRHPLVALLSLQGMLAAGVLLAVGFAHARGEDGAHAFALIVLAVGAAQLGVGLAVLVAALPRPEATDLEVGSDPR